MSKGWRNICPVCGNQMQNGVCWRCNAISTSRKKGWRRGDRGGVRPERRNYHKTNLHKDQSKLTTTSAKRSKRRIARKKKKPFKGFLRSLQGEWFSFVKNIKVNIDLAHNRWVFTLPSGKSVSQVWKPKEYSHKRLIFVCSDKQIEATIAEGGILLLTGKHGPVPFVNIQSGKKHRLCRWCYRKSEWWRKRCKCCRSKY